jgi:imidazolonepropionase
MLPGACVQLRLPVPPVVELRKAGVKLAVATDLNPGSSFSEALPVQMWLATTHYGMTVEEAWLGVTRHAADVLDRPRAGRLQPDARADAVLWDAEHPAEICYHYGVNLVAEVVAAGRRVHP